MAVRPIDAGILQDNLTDIYGDGNRLVYLKDVLGLIDEQPTLTPPNEWVSVEERLPEDDVPAGRKQITVLVCSKAKKVLVASRIYEPEREYNEKVYPARWRWSKLMNNYVTHWMPLPAPYDRRPPEGEEDT